MAPRPERRAAYRLGHRAEWLALWALMLRGYWPLARRVSLAGGEIDLIMRRGRTLVCARVSRCRGTGSDRWVQAAFFLLAPTLGGRAVLFLRLGALWDRINHFTC